MKRKSRLVEDFPTTTDEKEILRHDLPPKLSRVVCANMFPNASSKWLSTLMASEKTCLKEGIVKKFHYKLPDGREMVEEYNMDTGVMVRRAWKLRSALGGDGRWEVEVGDAIPEPKSIENVEIMESGDQPIVTRRNTRINLEWRIRNLPYPIETYSISASTEEGCIVVRTTNKKYFKKLNVPELQRLHLPIEQANIQSSHKFSTLIILYKKPRELLEFEKALFDELKKISPKVDSTEVPGDCKPS